ncbi:heterokaryon incompatibility protein-domain-containing protein [Hypoxylon sp. NC0597]|nr:heterokaryon incompatibility protein-domain-containing protein [Hypoxylon sp. NC0597]
METWNADIASLLYSPLDGVMPFRLLRLHPGKAGEHLSTELIPTSVDDADSQYEAISYTWGSPANPPSITCNNLNLIIQRNAFDMLHDLRQPDKPRIIWVDAICIDQSNVEERASQVSIMHHIYRRSKRVVIWLGKPDEYSSLAMSYAAGLDAPKLIAEPQELGLHGRMNAWEVYSRKPYFFDSEGETESSQHETLGIALVKFINRPWFNRIWVQQEAALCRRTQVICGEQEVGWDNVYALAWVLTPRSIEVYPDYISDDQNSTLNNLAAIQHIQRRRRQLYGDSHWHEKGRKNISPFSSCIADVSRFGATDPRDKMYALQCFAEDANEWFEVDYRVPWEILYTDVARRFLQQGILGFLKSAGRARQKPDGVLPSWAPDFRDGNWSKSTIEEHPSWMAGGPKTDYASACPGRAAGSVHNLPKRHRKRLNLPDRLKTYKDTRKSLLQSYASFKCMMADEIIYIADVVEDPFDVKATLDVLRTDLHYIEKLEPQTYINGESIADAYKLTLILSSDRSQLLVDSKYVCDNWGDWIQWLEDPLRGRDDMPIWEYSMEAAESIHRFRFAMTSHGYFCLVPQATKRGDVVSIFVGYSLGVVIRPWQPPLTLMKEDKGSQEKPRGKEDTEYFEFIGDSYIHGMMNNEARCVIEEFNCRHNPTQTQLNKMLQTSDSGNGEAWKTLGLHGGYERILETLGDHMVRLV